MQQTQILDLFAHSESECSDFEVVELGFDSEEFGDGRFLPRLLQSALAADDLLEENTPFDHLRFLHASNQNSNLAVFEIGVTVQILEAVVRH